MIRDSKNDARETDGKRRETQQAADASRPQEGGSGGEDEMNGHLKGVEGPPGTVNAEDEMIRLGPEDLAEVIRKKDEEIVKKNEEIAALKDILTRRQADFENYKKRVVKSQDEYRNLAIRDMSRDIININDDLLRAVEAAGAVSENCTVAEARASFLEGISMISKQVEEVLKKYGIEEIESLNREFDPAFNEAVEIDESAEVERDTITRVYRKGFKMGESVVRAAKVRVSRPERRAGKDGCEGCGLQNGSQTNESMN
ncbi:MAG TPA: nucleotide exchange factor GrpE [Spirochaetota bacterium]|nr:nucleotide exchange factor GrpE [Spirochaetota bacterium]